MHLLPILTLKKANKSHHILSRTPHKSKILVLIVDQAAGMEDFIFKLMFSYETVKSRGKKRAAKYKDESSDGEDSDFS